MKKKTPLTPTKSRTVSPKNKTKSPQPKNFTQQKGYSNDEYDYDYDYDYDDEIEKNEKYVKNNQNEKNKKNEKKERLTFQSPQEQHTPEKKKPVFKKEFYISEAFSEMYKQLCHEKDITDIFNDLLIYQKEFISGSTSLAEKQAQYWYQSVLQQLAQNGIQFDPNVTYFESLSLRSKDFFESHRISASFHPHYSFRAYVGGPSQSGKSTLLATLAEQFLIELVSSDLYKTTFVFGLDYSQIALSIQDMAETLRIFATSTIKFLAAQRPLLSQYADSLIHTFIDIPYGHSSFPKAFAASPDFRLIAPQVRSIIEEIKTLWKDSTAGNSVLFSIFLLPTRLAHIFGFKSVAVFFDHLDLLKLDFPGSGQFSETPLTSYPYEQAKYFLNGTNFILSYRDSTLFTQLLEDSFSKNKTESDSESESEKGIALRNLEIISTLDLVKDEIPQNENQKEEELIINVAGGHPKIILKQSMFGGCPNYLYKWNEMKENADLLDELEDVRDKEEQQLVLNAIVEKYLNEIFQLTSTNDKSHHFVVKNVVHTK